MSLQIVDRPLLGWGTTYGPPGDGPFPAVMVLHGSEGAWSGWSHLTAAILAAHGFLAFPLGYSTGGNMWNAGDIAEVLLDRSVRALAALRASGFSNGQVAVYGISRGAEHALLLASLMARDQLAGLPEAVAAHAAPDVVCGGFAGAAWRDAGDPGWQSWDPGQRAWTWNGSHEGLLPTTPIEVERYDGPLFLSHGVDDPVWSVAMTRRLEQRLRQHGRTPETHYLAGQGHMPHSDERNGHHCRLIDFFRRSLRTGKVRHDDE